MTHGDQLKRLWERYLSDLVAAPLLAFLGAHPRATLDCGHEYPHLHRVCDVALSGRMFRVNRCVTCGEALFFRPIPADVARPDEPGVPYRLSGAKLARWVDDVRRNDPKEETDWELYV